MAQSLLKRIRDKQPGVEIDVLAPGWTLALIERMPEVRQGIEMPIGHGKLALAERYRLGRSLRGRYRQAVVLPNSLKSALIPWFAKIPLRTGFKGEMRYGLLNDLRHLDKQFLPTMTERFVALAEPKGVYPEQRPVPKLTVSESSKEAILRRLGLTAERPILGVCPGAEYGPAKRWPAEHHAKVAEHALSRGWQVWLFGSEKDLPVTQEICALGVSGITDLAGRTSLGEACDLLSMCELVVTNDSGLMHVAAALERKMICIYGSSDPGFTPPLTEKATILQIDIECSPCFERSCRYKHYRCLTDLNPARVIQAMESGLSP